MQTGTGHIHYVADDFSPGNTTPYQLMIDASSGEEPLLSLFDVRRELKFFGRQAAYDAQFPDFPLGSLMLDTVRGVVPTVDLLFFPNDLYDQGNRHAYLSYLQDDGVSEVKDDILRNLNIRALYRNDLSNMTALFHQFPSMETIPLSCLLPDSLARGLTAPTCCIHRGERTVVFYIIDHSSLYYHNVFQCANEDEFNYYLIHVLRLFGEKWQDLRVLLSGNIFVGDTYYQRAAKYLQHVDMAEPAGLTGLPVPELPDEVRARLLPVYLLAAIQ